MPTPVKIPASDGFLLSATRYDPPSASRGVVVIASAMGVKHGYYGPFAQYLSEQGFTAVTWDYRGVGQSRPGPSGPLKLVDWAEKDFEGVLQWALAQGGPIGLVGHSLGTQLLGLVPSADRVSAVVGVGSQAGEWRHWPFPHNAGMLLLSSVLLPAVCGVFGKLPRGLMGEEVPKGPILDWARWIRSPGYLLCEGVHMAPLYARIRCAMTGVSIDDDRYAPRQPVDALYAIYSGARVERLHLTPKEFNVKAIGHFGAFRREFRDSIWPVFHRALSSAMVPVDQSRVAG